MSAISGCGDSTQSLEGFESTWRIAVSQGHSERLYHLLNVRSRRRVDQMLDTVRGFEPEARQMVLKSLDAKPDTDLENMTPATFFQLWWDVIFAGTSPDITIESGPQPGQAPVSPDIAWMVLSIKGRKERIQLSKESGLWVWQLPQETGRAIGTNP